MTALGPRIAQLIAAQGPISIAQYMALALHDPEAGYYATRDPLGTDFTTAPEISQMFGELLGLWCVAAWRTQGSPRAPLLVELGPGRGTLMADALRAMRAAPDLLAELEVVLVEASPVLRQAQHDRLKDCGVPIRWTAHFEESDRPLLLLANEFFDALPIRQYVKTARGWCERMVVAAQTGTLDFALAPLPTPPAALPPDRSGAPDGAVYEVSPAAAAIIESVARQIAAQGGAALVMDYGYGEVGFGETLQAMKAGRFARILTEPGENDLSAHVDFTALAAAARHGGAAAFGPQPQGEFLAGLGLAARAAKLALANPEAAPALQAAVTRLAGREQMGRLFQAMAITPPSAPNPPGF